MATGTVKVPIIKEKLMTDVQISASNKTMAKSLDGYDFLYIQVSSIKNNGSSYGNHMPFIFKLPLEGDGAFFVNYFVSTSLFIQFNFYVSGNSFNISWLDIEGYQKGRINAWGIKFA